MMNTRHKTSYRSLLGSCLIGLLLTGMAGLVGCAYAGGFQLPDSLQSRLQSPQSTADDHKAAAQLYQQQAQQLKEQAARYAREADSISQLEDTKGFRRTALKTAAREREKEATELSMASAEHLRQAETMIATRTRN
jgi:hypothetical protein